MIPWSVLWAILPKRYLIGAGAAIAALLLGWTAFAVHEHRLKSAYFAKGYQFAADSAAEATIQRLKAQHLADEARADSTYRVAQQASAPLDSQRTRFAAAVQHTPRIEALTVPIAVDTSMVGVFVENTGEHFILPRKAAQYWHTSDSLVTVAAALLKKYETANKQWASAWADEHAAREGADSLAAAYAARLRSVELTPRSGTNWTRRAEEALVFMVAGAVVHNQIRHR